MWSLCKTAGDAEFAVLSFSLALLSGAWCSLVHPAKRLGGDAGSTPGLAAVRLRLVGWQKGIGPFGFSAARGPRLYCRQRLITILKRLLRSDKIWQALVNTNYHAF